MKKTLKATLLSLSVASVAACTPSGDATPLNHAQLPVARALQVGDAMKCFWPIVSGALLCACGGSGVVAPDGHDGPDTQACKALVEMR